MDRSADIAIVGAGIVGLAHAYMALRKGYKVVLFDREQFAVGASVRNFGLLWSIGQEPGVGFERALRGRKHWQEVAEGAGLWINNNGSLHVVFSEDELTILEEFMQLYGDSSYQCRLMKPAEIVEKYPVVRKDNLQGGLFSDTESTVNAREAIRRIPLWLQEKYGLILKFGHAVTEISVPHVKTARESWRAEKVFVCSGADFETLYPEVFDQHSVTKCKLQMLKAVPEKKFTLGPTLCAGLTLRHYAAFNKCSSLSMVASKYDAECLDYKDHGVHVLLAQNNYGELIIGDSHHYAKTPEPFDREDVNQLILKYLDTFTSIGPFHITERWNGVYPKVADNSSLILNPEQGVTIVTGLGGAGMTLSFGLAEELVDAL
ncbi:MAG TPA: TIGR03364 family FAD-dependent oxidoreductase [Chryseolinea sp.]|nr:TIGR03364 family FAD-dependent oxidoreductase [Chryseolinea sp.]